jgi:hypothetical protein
LLPEGLYPFENISALIVCRIALYAIEKAQSLSCSKILFAVLISLSARFRASSTFLLLIGNFLCNHHVLNHLANLRNKVLLFKKQDKEEEKFAKEQMQLI